MKFDAIVIGSSQGEKPVKILRFKNPPGTNIRIVACAILFSLLSGNPAKAAPPVGQIERVASPGMVVSDMDRSVAFYSQVLTFEKIADVEVAGDAYEHLEGLFGIRMRVVRMRLGEESIELKEFLTPPGRPMPIDSRSNDRWFQHIAIIVSDMDRAYGILRENKVKHASTGPQTLPDYIKGAGGIRAFYFRDPDGHFIEILQFPPDKGDPKWHRSSGKLFLGIDHTAIVVGDTEKSLRFYQETLGMRIAGESENYGSEQEHLNNVFGARLRITSLRASVGPGVELLEYLAPRDGRRMPEDSQTSDVWAWETIIVVADLEATAQTLRERKYIFLSTGPVTLPDARIGFLSGFLVRDPDGHIIGITRP
jgi:catechol 2,3-dioxygenase-like lactoylglutathione lyase family enzyme